MADPETPHEHPRKPTEAPGASSSGIRLEHIEGTRRYPTGFVVGYHFPCTATEDKACHINHHLTEWNTLLFAARFELQELPGARGRLSLVSFSNTGLHLTYSSQSESSHSYRAVHRLLTTHHCIVSLHIAAPMSSGGEALLCDALRRNSSLKMLKVHFSGLATQTDLPAVIQCLTSLEEVECVLYTMRPPVNFAAALCTLLRRSSSLTSIRIYGLLLEDQQSKAMMAALLRNSTLREFNMSACLAEESHEGKFTNYLRFTTTLTTLRMAARDEQTQNSLLQGVLQNRTLSSLSLTRFICSGESNRLMARIFRENEVLLDFRIMSIRESPSPHRHGDDDWIAALAENNTLQDLTLPLSIWFPDKWAKFFRMLSVNSNLKKARIEMDDTNFALLSSLCRALAESGAEEKVSCGNCVVINNVDALKYRVFSGVYIFSGAAENVALAALRQLPQCAHLTYLAMDVSKGDLALSSALADYIMSAPHLLKLQLSVGWAPDMAENVPNEWWSVIVKSLSTSERLKELLILTTSLQTEHFEGLADSVRNSQSIRTFCMMDEIAAEASSFVTRLSTGIAENYSLRDVRLHGRLNAEATRSWFAVCETTRRNSSILARAVEFTEGRHLDRYVAGALERVSLHTALMEDLAELCHTTKVATAVSVRACLRSFESMDAFMRLAGVVRERVVCHPRDDGALQLDQLNHYCWSHVRQYLMLEDIKNSDVQTAQAGGRQESSTARLM